MSVESCSKRSSAGARPAVADGHCVHLFDPSVQHQVAATAAIAPEVADLASSFPAALFAISTGYGTAERRSAALAKIAGGAPLREVGKTLGLPWWLRKLPPASFTRPIPALPDDAGFNQAIPAVLARWNGAASEWLDLISFAARTCDAEFALWVARQPTLRSEVPSPIILATLSAWAWTSLNPGTDLAVLLRRGWSPEMSLKRALEERGAWLQRVALQATLTVMPPRDWVADGEACGFQFRRLCTATDFIAAAETLDNCLDQYAEPMASGATAVFGVHRHDKLIACIELRPHADHLGLPGIAQVKGARNRRSGVDVWRAAYAWLGANIVAPRSVVGADPMPALRLKAIDVAWQPFVQALPPGMLKDELAVLLRNAILQRLPRVARQRPGAPRATSAGEARDPGALLGDTGGAATTELRGARARSAP